MPVARCAIPDAEERGGACAGGAPNLDADRRPGPTAGFAGQDLRALLGTRGIGPRVVERLELAGFCSLDQLRKAGPEAVTAAVCKLLGTRAWANRRRAIRRALDLACVPVSQADVPRWPVRGEARHLRLPVSRRMA
jgi:hypothetical protein